MKNKYRRIQRSAAMGLAVLLIFGAAGCDSAAYRGQIQPPATEPTELNIVIEESSAQEQVLEGIGRMTPEGPEYEILKDLPIPETEPAPEYYRIGVEHENVAKLQERLMELGFMDNDEPTEYYGNVTQSAVKSFQRQNGLAQDGIIGPSTWEAIMDPAAKYYSTSNGDQGEDIQRIQSRLYELGYLATEDLVTGNFGFEIAAGQ